MKAKRFFSLVLISTMLISCFISYANASEPTEYYYSEYYKTSGAGEYMTVNLNDIFKSGETYQISFNIRPTDTNVFTPVFVTVEDGATPALTRGLVRLYNDKGAFHGMGASDYGNIGYIPGYKSSIARDGIKVEMKWNTANGNVAFVVTLPGGDYPEVKKTYSWNAGVITDYGNLKLGGDAAVEVNELKIKNINAKDIEPDPTGSYHLDTYKTGTGEYLKVNLDRVIQSGLPYKIKLNMKPDDLNGKWCGCVNFVDGDINISNANGNNYGLFNWYNTGDEAMGLSYWDKIGTVAKYKEVAFQNGINVEIIWDTAMGTANVIVDFTEKQYKYDWTPGVITGKYGKLSVGADSTGMTITDLDISLADGYATKSPKIQSENIKFIDCDDNETSLDDIISSDTKEIKIDFDADMQLSTLNADNIIICEKESGNKVEYDIKKTVNSYTMSLENLLKPNCDYVLKFKGDISNTTGDKIGSDTEFEFKTGDGVFGFRLNGLSVGDNKNPAIGDILNSTGIVANVSVKNTTESTKSGLLIITYFNGDEMLKAVYESFTTDADVKNKEISRDISVTPPAGADNVRIFLWDGIKSMITYGDVLNIK